MFAYLDTFNGLVPCKVLRIEVESEQFEPGLHFTLRPRGCSGYMTKVTIQITKTTGAYKRGEILTRGGDNIVPRYAVFRRKYSTSIGAYYSWARYLPFVPPAPLNLHDENPENH